MELTEKDLEEIEEAADYIMQIIRGDDYED